MMYNLVYTVSGVKCYISPTVWSAMTDKAKQKVITMCEQMKAKLVIR